MIRGTSPTLILNINGEFVFDDVAFLQVTLTDKTNHSLTYYKNNCTWDAGNHRLLIQMSQADTLTLSGKFDVQMRFQYRAGHNTIGTDIAKSEIKNSLSNNIIGHPDPTAIPNPAVTGVSLTPQSNDEEMTITPSWGTTIPGKPEIEAISVNGVVVDPVAGVVDITIPTSLDELAGIDVIREAITANESAIAEQAQNLAQCNAGVQSNAQNISRVETATNASIQALQQSINENASAIANVESNIAGIQGEINGVNDSVDALGRDKANKGDSYTKSESDAKFLTEHQPMKTINGQSIVGNGNIVIEGGTGTVQSVSVNGGTPATPDEAGNINLEIAEGGAKQISDLSDGNRVANLEEKVSNKVDTISMGGVDYKPTDGKVTLPSGGGSNLYTSRGQQEDGAPTNKLLDDELNKIEASIPLVELTTTSSKIYIITNVGIGNVVSLKPKSSTSTFRYFIHDCKEGDVIIVSGIGGDEPRLWAFLDADNVLLSVAEKNATADRMRLIAPPNTAKLIINDKSGATSYYSKVDSISKQLDDVHIDITTLQEEVDGLDERVYTLEQQSVVYELADSETIKSIVIKNGILTSSSSSNTIKVIPIVKGRKYKIRYYYIGTDGSNLGCTYAQYVDYPSLDASAVADTFVSFNNAVGTEREIEIEAVVDGYLVVGSNALRNEKDIYTLVSLRTDITMLKEEVSNSTARITALEQWQGTMNVLSIHRGDADGEWIIDILED